MKALLRAAFASLMMALTLSSADALPTCAPMDFDADCKSDILWRNTATGENHLYLMNGATVGSSGLVNYIGGQNYSGGYDWEIRGVGDFDGDGKADILWRNFVTGDNYMYLMNGWTIASRGLVNNIGGQEWQIVGIGDFDGDRRADILWRNIVTGDNYMYLMNGWTIASRGLVNNVGGQEWQIVGIGDFDGDGRSDILWRNFVTGENYMYLMNGWTIASRGLVNYIGGQKYSDGNDWHIRGIGDFDGDGKADILWRNVVTGENYMYLMNGWTIAARGLVNVLPDPVWQVAGIGDFDGDGRADILWRSLATGENYVYLMNGWTIASEGHINTMSDLSWMPLTASTIRDATGPDTAAPSIPAGLSASAVSSSRIDLTWRAASDNVAVTRYGVYRNGVHVANVSGTSYSSTGLAAATTHTYAVAAYDAAGNASAVSNAVSATTQAPPDTQPPSTPANLAATVVSASQINLSWSAATDNVGVAGYRVYRDGMLVASAGGTLVSVTGLSSSALYSFTVSAFDAAGNASAPSAPLPVSTADATAPTIPMGLTVSAVTSSSLTLSWSAATDNIGVTGYRVYRDGTLIGSAGTTSMSTNGLLAGALYSFTVSAFDAAGNVSAPSAPLAVTTPVPALTPQVLWSAGMETGDLRQWDDETNSGSADSVAVTAASAGIPAKSGNWVMRQSVTGSGGGTRMARFPEVDALRKAGTTFYVSWWDYYPTAVNYAPGNMFAIFQVASQDSLGGFHPLWGLFFHPWNNTLQLVWSPNRMAPAEGPHAGESGSRVYSSTRAVPVRQWVFFEVMITPSSSFTGAIKVWMNGEVLFDQTLVKTRFPDVGAGGFMWFNLLAYGSALTPTPLHHYVDDVTISLGRVPYAP